MLELYLAICIIGLILLVVFAFLGGFGGADADFGDVGGGHDIDIGHDIDGGVDIGDADTGLGTTPNPLSLPIILVFMTAFGAFGMILEVFELNWVYVPFVAATGGVLISGAMFFVMLKVFAAVESSSVVSLKKLVGKTGNVSIPIRKGVEGQVVVVSDAGRKLIGAIADSYIPSDSVVIITNVMGDIVKVRKIEQVRKKKSIK